jgi:hypothetical protein
VQSIVLLALIDKPLRTGLKDGQANRKQTSCCTKNWSKLACSLFPIFYHYYDLLNHGNSDQTAYCSPISSLKMYT